MQIVVKVNKKAAEPSSAAKYFMERETRFELATRGLGSRCSTTELHPHDYQIIIAQTLFVAKPSKEKI